MKKIKVMLTVFCACIACLLLLTSCSAKLSAPTSFRLDGDTLTLHWNKVKEAAAYTIEIGDTISVTTRDNSYSLESLEPGEYVVRVQAITYGDDYDNSNFAEYKFTREKESGLRYKLNGARNAYELVGIGSASGDVVMEDYYRGKPVTSIGKAALRRCGRITSFVIGKNVQTIGENAFYACAELTSVTIPEGVTSIGNAAFQSCNKLETVVLPNSLESVSEYMFSMCKILKNVTIGTGVTSIGKYAFSDCIALESITIPDAATFIGEFAFSNCAALTKANFGTDMQTIDDYAFYNCMALRSVVLNNRIKTINEGAFALTALTSVALPDSVTTVGSLAFAQCADLADVTLGKGLTAIGYGAFFETALVENYEGDVVVVNDWIIAAKNMELTDYTAPDNVIGIADIAFFEHPTLSRVRLPNVKYIGVQSFSACNGLWEVSMSDSNTHIGRYAFAFNEVLTDVYLGQNLEEIGEYAFYGCERLEDSGIDLPKSLKNLGYGVFMNTQLFYAGSGIVYVDDWAVGVRANGPMKSAFIKEGTRGIANYAFRIDDVQFDDGVMYIPDSVEYIGNGAFYGNKTLTTSNLPASLKRVGNYAFADCTYLWLGDYGAVNIPEGCEYIGEHAFRACSFFVSLNIPGTVKYIGKSAFKYCNNLGLSGFTLGDSADGPPLIGDVVLGEGIEYIGDQAFFGCSGLLKITLPNSLKEMGVRTFYKCEKMVTANFGTGLAAIPSYAFYDCTALESVTVPGNVKTIGNYAFRGCTALKQVTLNEGVETVDKYAFYRCENVEQLTIADSVTSIGDFAFRGMSHIKSICLSDNLTYVGRLAFYGANEATIYYEGTQIPETWSPRWNASFAPLVMGAVLSEDNAYVTSWTAVDGGLVNLSEFRTLSTPSREGYTFVGWATTQDAQNWQYAALSDVPAGTTVYAVWTDAVVEETPDNSDVTQTPAQ